MATGDCVISFRPTTDVLKYPDLVPQTDGTLTWYKSSSSQTFAQATEVGGLMNYLQASTTQKLYVKMSAGSYMTFKTAAANSDIEIVSCFPDLQLLLPSCSSLVLPSAGEIKQLQLYKWTPDSDLDISSWKVKNFILSPAAFKQSKTFICKNNDYIESIDTTSNTYGNISVQFCKNLTEIILCKVKYGLDILSSVVAGQTKSAAITGQLPATVTFMDQNYTTLALDTALESRIQSLQEKGWVFNLPPTQAQIDAQKDPFPQGQSYEYKGVLYINNSSAGTNEVPAVDPYWIFTDAYMSLSGAPFKTVCDHSWHKDIWGKSGYITGTASVHVYQSPGKTQLQATYQPIANAAANTRLVRMCCQLPLTHLTVKDTATDKSTLQLTDPAKLKSVTIVNQPAGAAHTKYLLDWCANNNTVTGGTFTTVAQIADETDKANADKLLARAWKVRDANGVYKAQPISSYGMMLISSTNTTVSFNNDAGVVQVIVNNVGSILQGTSFTLSGGKVTYVYGDNITRLTAHNLTRLDLLNNLKLVNLDCSNGSLSYLNIDSHMRLTELKAQNNKLPTSIVDSILASLAADGSRKGSVNLQNNSAPSSRANIDTLESRGWTVLTDYVDPVLSDSSSSSGGGWKHE